MKRCLLPLLSLLLLAGCPKSTATSRPHAPAAKGEAPRPGGPVYDGWKLLADHDPNEVDNWSVGSLYRWIVSTQPTAAYSEIQRQSGISVFMDGSSHSVDTLDLHSRQNFGHYNPAFVQWAADTLIPAKDDPLIDVARIGFALHLRTHARRYLRVYHKLEANPDFRDKEILAYRTFMAGGRGASPAFKYTSFFGEHRYDGTSVVVAWWLRRHIDGSAPMFADALEQTFLALDPDFLTKTQNEDFRDRVH